MESFEGNDRRDRVTFTVTTNVESFDDDHDNAQGRSVMTGSFFDAASTDVGRSWIVAVAGGANFFVLFGLMGSFTVFLESFKNDPKFEGSSTAALNLAGSLQLGVARVVGMFAGYLASRYGTRVILVVGAVAHFLAYFCASYAPSVGALVGIYTAGMVFAVGLTLVPVLSAANSYFAEKRTLAQGIINAGSGLGAAAFPLITSALLTKFDGDWRPVFRVCSAFSVVMLISAVFLPTRPDPVAQTPASSPIQFSRRKLYTSRAFIVLSIFCLGLGFSIYAENFMVMPYSQQFTDRSTAVFVAFAAGIATVIGSVVVGYITDLVGALPAQIGLYVLNGALCIAWALGVKGLLSMFIVTSVQYFFRAVGTATIIAEVFRGHHLPEALAGTYFFIGVGGAMSPPIAAAITTSTGSYDAALYLCAATSVVAGLVLLLLPKEKPNLYDGPHPATDSLDTEMKATIMAVGAGSPVAVVKSRRQF